MPLRQISTELGHSIVIQRDGNRLLLDLAYEDGQYRTHLNREEAMELAAALMNEVVSDE